MACNKCGNEIPGNARFCNRCGEGVQNAPEPKKKFPVVVVTVLVLFIGIGLAIYVTVNSVNNQTVVSTSASANTPTADTSSEYTQSHDVDRPEIREWVMNNTRRVEGKFGAYDSTTPSIEPEPTYDYANEVDDAWYSDTYIPEIEPDIYPENEVRGNSVGNIVNGGRVAQSGDWIYHSFYIDKNSGMLFKMRTDGSEMVKIDGRYSYINVVGDWVYYSDGIDDGKLYKIRTDGSGKIKLNDDRCSDINVVGDWIYYWDWSGNWNDKGRLYKIRTDGSGRVKMNDGLSFYINVVNDWVYYCDRVVGSLDGGLHTIRTDGSGKVKLYDGHCDRINIVGNWIYFDDPYDQNYSFNNRISINGTEVKRLEYKQ